MVILSRNQDEWESGHLCSRGREESDAAVFGWQDPARIQGPSQAR
jgi:hypothetical protein